MYILNCINMGIKKKIIIRLTFFLVLFYFILITLHLLEICYLPFMLTFTFAGLITRSMLIRHFKVINYLCLPFILRALEGFISCDKSLENSDISNSGTCRQYIININVQSADKFITTCHIEFSSVIIQ